MFIRGKIISEKNADWIRQLNKHKLLPPPPLPPKFNIWNMIILCTLQFFIIYRLYWETFPAWSIINKKITFSQNSVRGFIKSYRLWMMVNINMKIRHIIYVSMQLPNLSTQNWSYWNFPCIFGSWSLLENSNPINLGLQSKLTSI